MRALNKPFYLKSEQGRPRYQVTHILGQGGMGTVFKAIDLRLRNEVAIKAMNLGLPDDADEQDFEIAKKDQARFRLEARALANLDHPNIVKVTDFFEGQLNTGTKTSPHYFYVMGYQENTETLEDMIKTSGPLDKQNIITLINQVGGAIEYSHSKGMVHRDLKPSQILLTRDREGNIKDSKLADFGLAKMLNKATGLQSIASLTAEGDVLGTPVYMPPEQIDGSSPITETADIYSWGATLFNALTGEIAMDFREVGQTTMAYLTRIIQYKDGDVQLRKISEFRDDVPENTQMYIERAMHPDPGQRTPSVRMLNKSIKNAYSPKKKSAINRSINGQGKSNSVIKTIGGILVGAAVLAGAYMLGNGNKTPDPIVNGVDPIHTEIPISDNGTSENPNTTKDPITPTVEKQAKLSFHIQGDYDQASVHPYVKQGDRFVPQHQGIALATQEGILDSEPGRFQIRVMYDDNKQFVVPIKIESGKTLDKHIFVPDFNPNEFRSPDNDKLTTSTWRYINVDNNGQDNSFWRLDQWTIQDHADFIEKGVLTPYVHNLSRSILENARKNGEQITSSTLDGIKANIYERLADPSTRVRRSIGRIFHEVVFRGPSHETATQSYGAGIHSQPFMMIHDKEIVPDPNQTRLTVEQMGDLPLTSTMRGSLEDPLNETNAFATSFARDLGNHLGSGYIVKIPSKEQYFISMTGGQEGSPIFAFGDRDQADPHMMKYIDDVTANGFDSLRTLSASSVSPYGVPMTDGAPSHFTDLSMNKGKTQMCYTVGFDENGYSVTEHRDPDTRKATRGVTYIIERSQ